MLSFPAFNQKKQKQKKSSPERYFWIVPLLLAIVCIGATRLGLWLGDKSLHRTQPSQLSQKPTDS